jgi:hypothetical protein
MPAEEYTIIVRGERFVLSRDQLYFDAPNYFTSLFCDSGFSETANGTEEVILHRDPHLFQIIQTHLSGYTIMPLPENWFPRYMSKDAALLNLLADARFYGLDKLVKTLEARTDGCIVPLETRSEYCVLDVYGMAMASSRYTVV